MLWNSKQGLVLLEGDLMSVVDVFAQTGETYHFVTEAAEKPTDVYEVVAMSANLAFLQVFLPSFLLICYLHIKLYFANLA